VGKIQRGGFVFMAWKGDHTPRHVHVYRSGRLIVKWDLENGKAMKGRMTRKVFVMIRALERERQL